MDDVAAPAPWPYRPRVAAYRPYDHECNQGGRSLPGGTRCGTPADRSTGSRHDGIHDVRGAGVRSRGASHDRSLLRLGGRLGEAQIQGAREMIVYAPAVIAALWAGMTAVGC